MTGIALDDPRYYFNRHLQWWAFNRWVLEEARDIGNPLLAHNRIFYFENGGKQDVYLGSADWMPNRWRSCFPWEPEESTRSRVPGATATDTPFQMHGCDLPKAAIPSAVNCRANSPRTPSVVYNHSDVMPPSVTTRAAEKQQTPAHDDNTKDNLNAAV